MIRRSVLVTVGCVLSLSLLVALPVNAEAPEGAPDPGIALPNLDDGNLGPVGDVANTGPALKRDLRKVLPKLSQMPRGTTLSHASGGEFCPGVHLEAQILDSDQVTVIFTQCPGLNSQFSHEESSQLSSCGGYWMRK